MTDAVKGDELAFGCKLAVAPFIFYAHFLR